MLCSVTGDQAIVDLAARDPQGRLIERATDRLLHVTTHPKRIVFGQAAPGED
jgi:hypothetical protein